MKKTNIINLLEEDLSEWLAGHGEPRFRLEQILTWIWKKRVESFDDMLNVSKSLRQKLNEDFELRWPKIVVRQSSQDGTIKYLIELEDGKTVESVWIPRPDSARYTLCVSSQVGCKMACTFCMTGLQKVERNLTAGEIAAQVFLVKKENPVSNVVMMGMGEPFDNYTQLLGGLALISSPQMLETSPRKITVSTSGLIPKIEDFLKNTKYQLAISLNASNEETRTELMPINKAYSIEKLKLLIDKIKKPGFSEFWRKSDKITFEYIVIAGVNDSDENARELIRHFKNQPVKFNLLFYNENPSIPYKRPSVKRVLGFQKILMNEGRFLTFIRNSRGLDISAACGQLASETKRIEVTAPPEQQL